MLLVRLNRSNSHSSAHISVLVSSKTLSVSTYSDRTRTDGTSSRRYSMYCHEQVVPYTLRKPKCHYNKMLAIFFVCSFNVEWSQSTNSKAERNNLCCDACLVSHLYELASVRTAHVNLIWVLQDPSKRNIPNSIRAYVFICTKTGI